MVRGTDSLNRTAVTFEFTSPGRKLVRQVTARRRRVLNRFLDRIEPAERAACAGVLRTLHERCDDDYTSHSFGANSSQCTCSIGTPRVASCERTVCTKPLFPHR